ncbi:MAG: NAD(+) diphosphatase [Emergencia sp.]|nr:NAD(+) diphosphatase [Emergencia sp.]
MIQDLGEKRLYNEFKQDKPAEHDKVFCFNNDRILVKVNHQGVPEVPSAAILGQDLSAQYLFRIGEEKFFLTSDLDQVEGCQWESVRNLRKLEIKELAFGAATAYHLDQWYRHNRFCGCCGKPMEHDRKERMLRCPHCGNMVYPRIAPAVIVAITKGDKILLTKYNGRVYKKYALIAGFTEIGETAEETVRREAMEEVGLRVKNITYYKSQPWGVDSNLLLGFFCEVDGDDRIQMDEEELSVAEWVHRSDMPQGDDGFSLTGEMMAMFRKGEK